MGAIDEMRKQMNDLRGMMEQLLGIKKGQGQVGNGATPVEGVPVNDPAVAELYKGFTKYLQDEGFISKKPLNKRNTDKGDAAPTPDEAPASVSGPVTALFGLRKLKEKIEPANFVEDLPNTAWNLAAENPNTTWNAQNVATVKERYNKLSEVVKELQKLMASLQI